MKYLKYAFVIGMVLFLGIQFIPRSANKDPLAKSTDFIYLYNAPMQVKKTLLNACYDCHSNQTKYPWYSNIQPIRLLMDGHVKEGKAELNFSEFGAYSLRRQKSKLKSMYSQIQDNEMPLYSYSVLHKSARLSKDKERIVLEWIDRTRDSL